VCWSRARGLIVTDQSQACKLTQRVSLFCSWHVGTCAPVLARVTCRRVSCQDTRPSASHLPTDEYSNNNQEFHRKSVQSMTGGFQVCACVFKQYLACVTIIGIFENISTYTMILPEKILHFYSLLTIIFFLSFKKSIIIIHDLISFSLSEDFLSEIRHRIYVKVDLTNHYPLLLHTAHQLLILNNISDPKARVSQC